MPALTKRHRPEPLLQKVGGKTVPQHPESPSSRGIAGSNNSDAREEPQPKMGDKMSSLKHDAHEEQQAGRDARDVAHLSPASSSDDSIDDRMLRANMNPTTFHSSRPPNTSSNLAAKRRKLDTTILRYPEAEVMAVEPPEGPSRLMFGRGPGAPLAGKAEPTRRATVTYGNDAKKRAKQKDVNSGSPSLELAVPEGLDSPSKLNQKSLKLPNDMDLSPPPKPSSRLRLDMLKAHASTDGPVFKSGTEDDCGAPPKLNPSQTLKRRMDQNSSAKAVLRRSSSPNLVVFKMPEHLQSKDSLRLNGEEAPPPTSSESSGDEPVGISAPSAAAKRGDGDLVPTLCPWCGEVVDEVLLRDFSKGKRLDVRMQTKFCQKHKKESAVMAWHSKRYPEVDWQKLGTKFEAHHGLLLEIVNGRPSHFRNILARKIESGKTRSLRKEGNLNPGYYGPRGFNLMCDYLVEEFGDMLKVKAVDDRVIAGRGSAAFIQCVLVAELAVRLIMEDMDTSEDDARAIMEESRALGEMVHGDV